jgi:hypothetical protein
MNFRQLTIVVVAAVAFPIASQAQESTSTVTRAQVRAELVQVEKAGYCPGKNDLYYPADIQKAEAKVAAANGSSVNNDSGVGGVTSTTFASGARGVAADRTSTMYEHH